MAQAQKANFAELIKGAQPVLVDVWAPWCGPCRMMEPSIKQLAETYKGQLTVIKVNIDDNPALARQYGIQGVPTLMLFKEGEKLFQQAGAMPYPQLKQLMSRYLPG